jgi:hypothetical protein
VLFFVGVADVAATLDQAEKLGGTIVQPAQQVPGVTFGVFARSARPSDRRRRPGLARAVAPRRRRAARLTDPGVDDARLCPAWHDQLELQCVIGECGPDRWQAVVLAYETGLVQPGEQNS